MKNILIVLVILLPFHSFSQDTNKLYFNNGHLKFVVLDSNNNVIRDIPAGKNVNVVYDKFFKSYYITYLDDKNVSSHFDLKYIKTYENGLILYNDIVENTNYTVYDLLLLGKKNGDLVLMRNSTKGDSKEFHALYRISK